MIESNHSEAFLRKVATSLACSGSLVIFALRFNGAPVAVLFCLRTRNGIFSYLSAVDPDSEKLGFGRELLACAIRYAHCHGYRQWNFLRGEEPYKFLWGAQRIPKCRVLISR